MAACLLAALAALVGISGAAQAQDLPRADFLQERKATTKEGHVALKWGGDGDDLVFELQSALEPTFSEPAREYEGTDEASFLSGLAGDHYYFRIRAREAESERWGPWSESLELVCEHHSMSLAWGLFAAGGLMFLLIVLFVGVNAFSPQRFESFDA